MAVLSQMLCACIVLNAVFVVTVSICSECDLPRHPQTMFCEADFAFKVTLEDRRVRAPMPLQIQQDPFGDPEDLITSELPDIIEYTARVLEIYKKSSTDSMVSGSTYPILSEDTGCASDLTTSKTYIVTGNYKDMERYTSVCHWNDDFALVGSYMEQQLQTGFQDCNSQILRCNCFDCPPTNSSNQCVWHVGKHMDCRYRFSTCLDGKWVCSNPLMMQYCQRSVVPYYCPSVDVSGQSAHVECN